ncbi:Zinc finger protein [Plakobranchus ocellatus]|uniref:Zinc finger protein n=1 Tax=Plakobranchus ocellatus TaxID=259542 RepID=A0AAV4D962_9GAST|nr:Zinc finger protein [Plakobranchus ocellatus]
MLQLASRKAVPVETKCSWAILTGEIGVREANGMKDTGGEGFVLRKGVVEKGQLTRESCLLIRIKNTALLAEKAEVNLRTPYLCGEVKALCIPDASYDVIVGRVRGPEDPDMSVMELADVKSCYGYVLNLWEWLDDTLKITREELQKIQSKQKHYYDRLVRQGKFCLGGKVLILLLTESNKLLEQIDVRSTFGVNDYCINVKRKEKTCTQAMKNRRIVALSRH